MTFSLLRNLILGAAAILAPVTLLAGMENPDRVVGKWAGLDLRFIHRQDLVPGVNLEGVIFMPDADLTDLDLPGVDLGPAFFPGGADFRDARIPARDAQALRDRGVAVTGALELDGDGDLVPEPETKSGDAQGGLEAALSRPGGTRKRRFFEAFPGPAPAEPPRPLKRQRGMPKGIAARRVPAPSRPAPAHPFGRVARKGAGTGAGLLKLFQAQQNQPEIHQPGKRDPEAGDSLPAELALWYRRCAALHRVAEAKGFPGKNSKEWAEGVYLGDWASRQRRLFRSEDFLPDQMEKLKAIPGWDPDPPRGASRDQAIWESHALALKAHIQKNHGVIPAAKAGVKENGIDLGWWLHNQRQALRPGYTRAPLEPWQKAFLDKHIPGWNPGGGGTPAPEGKAKPGKRTAKPAPPQPPAQASSSSSSSASSLPPAQPARRQAPVRAASAGNLPAGAMADRAPGRFKPGVKSRPMLKARPRTGGPGLPAAAGGPGAAGPPWEAWSAQAAPEVAGYASASSAPLAESTLATSPALPAHPPLPPWPDPMVPDLELPPAPDAGDPASGAEDFWRSLDDLDLGLRGGGFAPLGL